MAARRHRPDVAAPPLFVVVVLLLGGLGPVSVSGERRLVRPAGNGGSRSPVAGVSRGAARRLKHRSPARLARIDRDLPSVWRRAQATAWKSVLPTLVLWGGVKLALDALPDEDEIVPKEKLLPRIDPGEREPSAAAPAKRQTSGEPETAERSALSREIFELADLDGDHVLNPREAHYGEYLEHLGRAVPRWEGDVAAGKFGLSDAARAFKRGDANGDRALDRAEYADAMVDYLVGWGWDASDMRDPRFIKQLEVIFHQADISGDGTLELRESQYAACLFTDILADMLTSVSLNQLDANRDGALDWQEVADAASDESAALHRIARAGDRRSLAELLLGPFTDGVATWIADREELKNVWRKMIRGIGCDLA